MTPIHGTCHERFAGVRAAFADLFAAHGEVGASAAVHLDGEPVVDLWGGHTDAARTTPWARDTLVCVWSTSKTVTNLCALVLADRGEIDLDAPVSRYWPEFAAEGKDRVEVRHLLAHTAGLPDWDTPLHVTDLYDWDKATTLLARQAPRWEPGTASGYHVTTQGHLVGEVIRRVTGRTVGDFLAAEVCGPLGADFVMSLPASEDHRVADCIPPSQPAAPKATPPPVPVRRLVDPEDTWTPEWRRAEVPAVGGFGNARSVATILSTLAGADTALLSEAGRRQVFRRQSHGVDLVLGVPITFGIGYALADPQWSISPNPHTCFWGGRGGSLAVVDTDARLVVTYTMNRMTTTGLRDPRGLSLVEAAYRALAT